MAFNLEVQFTGLCLYVEHSDGQRVTVLMPDGRRAVDQDPYVHADGDDAAPHVGYLRVNLADLGFDVPHGTDESYRDGPEYEVIRRFDAELLDFGLPEAPITAPKLVIPDFGAFAPRLGVRPELFTDTPPRELLMRAVLTGGTLTSKALNEHWVFDTHLNPGGPVYGGRFASTVTWARRVEADHLELRLTRFRGAKPPEVLRLTPEPEGVVSLKIANLCAENPLEWEEMYLRSVKGEDRDFRWLYRLMQTQGTPFEVLLAGMRFPVPKPIGIGEGSREDCMPAKIRVSF